MDQNSTTKKIESEAGGNSPSYSNPSADRKRARRRRPRDKDADEISFRNIAFLLFLPAVFVYFELVLRLFHFGSLGSGFFGFAVFFAVSAGLFWGVICSLFSQKVNYVLTLVVLGLHTLLFGVQIVYVKFFKTFLDFGTLGVGGEIYHFWRETLGAIWSRTAALIFLFVPFVLFAIFGRRKFRVPTLKWGTKAVGLALALLLFLGGRMFVGLDSGPDGSLYHYRDNFDVSDSVSRFGLITAFRLDTQNTLKRSLGIVVDDVEELTTGAAQTTFDIAQLFGTTKPLTTTAPGSQSGTQQESTSGEGTSGGSTGLVTDPATTVELTTEAPPPPLDTSPNVLDIDFDKLIANASTTALKNAHTWFSTREPTNKNEYTGLFKGKNLIVMTVEAWAPAAISKELTPTLWKMKNEGFVFENYFCSMWGGSTATGEYACITGNFYNNASCLEKSADTYEPFTLGNMLKKQGYVCNGFHNWTATYYSRDKAHPNFGYVWHGTTNVSKGDYPGTNGWNVTFSRAWPTSDFELAKNTLSYLNTDNGPFHIYYMTVSGHPYHTGNRQATKHKAEALAAGLPYTDNGAILYVSAEYEVELMVSALIEDLEKKGLLEDTVFVMAPDHYPYSVSDDDAKTVTALSQLYGIPESGIFNNMELYRAPLIIWSASMKQPVKVSKVCSAPDILPTVLNLFGLEYDSRLIMGQDILSTKEGFAILNMSAANSDMSFYNWLCDYGFYNNKDKKFYPFEGVTVDETALKNSGYISYHNQLVTDMYKDSKYILDQDYYRKVFSP
ncbi:MAG: LTA synthase family protein [Clostridia bacterium]|nr:LTA synthase family protein [Clostridia bacterium]